MEKPTSRTTGLIFGTSAALSSFGEEYTSTVLSRTTGLIFGTSAAFSSFGEEYTTRLSILRGQKPFFALSVRRIGHSNGYPTNGPLFLSVSLHFRQWNSLFFSGSFASIFWMKKRGLMLGLKAGIGLFKSWYQSL